MACAVSGTLLRPPVDVSAAGGCWEGRARRGDAWRWLPPWGPLPSTFLHGLRSAFLTREPVPGGEGPKVPGPLERDCLGTGVRIHIPNTYNTYYTHIPHTHARVRTHTHAHHSSLLTTLHQPKSHAVPCQAWHLLTAEGAALSLLLPSAPSPPPVPSAPHSDDSR